MNLEAQQTGLEGWLAFTLLVHVGWAIPHDGLWNSIQKYEGRRLSIEQGDAPTLIQVQTFGRLH